MRVLQLIDSLRPGGAEQMAVSYANALSDWIDGSYLCCTRKEGLLRIKISTNVGYLFLEKNNTLDLSALLKLRRFIKENNIDLIQAHGSSFFFALLVKMSSPNVKLVWHDHWGERALKNLRPGMLKPASLFFDGVMTANLGLKSWAEKKLLCLNVKYFKNFIPFEKFKTCNAPEEKLKGEKTFRIICIANLKTPKDHLSLLKSLKSLVNHKLEVSLHLVGRDYFDEYSRTLIEFVNDNGLENRVFFYGEQMDISSYISQADLGVLSSTSEGLPVTLLEYGRGNLPVVCTDVGECAGVIGNSGKLVPAGNIDALANALKFYIENPKDRQKDASAFSEKIRKEFSEEVIVKTVIHFFHQIVVRK